MKISLTTLVLFIWLGELAIAEEIRQQVVVKVQAPSLQQQDKTGKSFGCPGSGVSGERDANAISPDEKYLHSWENGKRPPLSTLKMVCKDLSDLKTGDYVFITVQGKEEVYELAGTDFGKEGSVYKVERIGDTFAFKHPSTSGFLFFNSPSYYVGVKRDSDALDMFQSYDNNETSFKLCYHEKLNGFVLKTVSNDKCLTVCEKLFGHSPCFRKDQCAAVRIYKIPAYCLQRQKTLESKANNKGTKKEQLEKIKQKEALVNTAKASGRGQSTATAGQMPNQVATEQSQGVDSSKFIPVREVRVNKKIIVHRKLPRDKQQPVQAEGVPTTATKSCTVSIVPVKSSTTTPVSTSCTFTAQPCTCSAKPCTCSVTKTTSAPPCTTSTSTVKLFITPKPLVQFVTSIIKSTVTSTRYSTQVIPTYVTHVVTSTSKIRTTITEKVCVTSTKTKSLTVTAVSEATATSSMTVTTSTSPIITEMMLGGEVMPIPETMISFVSESSTLYPTVTCYTTETIDTYV